jgi:hypothetical protein
LSNNPNKIKINNLVSAIQDNLPSSGAFEQRRFSEKNIKFKNQTQTLKEQLFYGSDEKAYKRESKFE